MSEQVDHFLPGQQSGKLSASIQRAAIVLMFITLLPRPFPFHTQPKLRMVNKCTPANNKTKLLLYVTAR